MKETDETDPRTGVTASYDEEHDPERVAASASTVPGADLGVGDVLGLDADIDPVEADRSRPFGAKLALLVVILTGTLVGVAGWPAVGRAMLAVPVATLGGVAVARATRAVSGSDNVRRARGSLGVLVGAGVLVGSVGAAATGGAVPAFVAAATGLAATSVGFGALVGVESDTTDHLQRAFRRSAVVLGVASLVSVVLFTGVLWPPLRFGIVGTATLSTISTYAAVVSLQVFAVLVIALFEAAVPVVDDWASRPEREDGLLEAWEQQGVGLEDVPMAYWAAFGLQLLLAMIPQVHVLVEWALSIVPVLGPVVQRVMTLGVLHLPLAVLMGLASLVLVARGIQHVVDAWAGHEPPRALSYAAGGLVLSALVLPLSVPFVGVPIAGALEAVLPAGPVSGRVGAIGPAATLLGGVAVLLGVTYFTLAVSPVFGALTRSTRISGRFGLGAALLFGAGAATVANGGHALLAFVTAAAAVLVWDFGDNAVGLVRQVGPDVDVRDAETTHAGGSVLVGFAGVGIATAAYYLLGWVSVPASNAANGFLAMILALVALIAFAHLVLEDETDE
jgi:hypothetical protein